MKRATFQSFEKFGIGLIVSAGAGALIAILGTQGTDMPLVQQRPSLPAFSDFREAALEP